MGGDVERREEREAGGGWAFLEEWNHGRDEAVRGVPDGHPGGGDEVPALP
jgi:hypothetical protein